MNMDECTAHVDEADPVIFGEDGSVVWVLGFNFATVFLAESYLFLSVCL